MADPNTMLQVTVPANAGPGSELHVQAPDGRVISAIVPAGCGPGLVFHVQAPPPVVVQGTPVKQQPKKYKRCSEEMKLLNEKGLVKIKVPKGLKEGDRFKVRIPDGRRIEAVVPPGNVSEFQVKVPPKKQNWHDNVIAVAPMTVGPFLT